jgi:hypothetical protein
MECPICYTNAPSYVINCGSTVEHTVCDTCEVTMRMKEPATSKGRILKCPMCRVPEKVPGKRSTFSYEYELSKMYAPAQRPAPRPTPRPAPRPVRPPQDWATIADRIRNLSVVTQQLYIRIYPQLAPYFENYIPEPVAATQAMRPDNAYCQSGRRETGVCGTRSKTKRKCTHIGCEKFVCRSCRQCLTH